MRELLPSLASTDSDRVPWPSDIHWRGGRLALRSGVVDHFFDDLCDRFGDAVTVRSECGAMIGVSRVLSADIEHGLLRVVVAGHAGGVPVADIRVASRHSAGRIVPASVCTASAACLCAAATVPADIHAGDVIAAVTSLRGCPLDDPIVAV